jgi:putative PIN family toxin of toxin-antitoxin system
LSAWRVVFDTNILLSAFLFGGNPEALFRAVRAGKIQLITSPSILAEFASILKNKFSWEGDIREALTVIGRRAELVKPKRSLAVLEDDADNRVLECALEASADFIISGDHHLLDMGEFRGIPILQASEFLDRIPPFPDS